MGCMASLDYTGKIDVGCIPIGKCLKLVQNFGVGSLKGYGRCVGLKVVKSCS